MLQLKVDCIRVTHPCATFIVLLLISFDLHVLGLPLAFILSQDQTLHCKKFWISDCYSKYIFWGPLFLLFKLQRTFLFLKGTAKVRLVFTFPRKTFKNLIDLYWCFLGMCLIYFTVFQNRSAKVRLVFTLASISSIIFNYFRIKQIKCAIEINCESLKTKS